jgi:5-methylcytosine-specific restriction endonuclease McrA
MSYKEDYSKFLKSEYWAKVRKKVLARDCNKCQFCGSKKRLEIHHYSYKNHLNELNHLDDLITLCKSCHEYTHEPDDYNEMIEAEILRLMENPNS